jgi:hypothetical protein
MGKQTNANSDVGWGTVQIIIYPSGTEIPPNKQPQSGVSSETTSIQPVQASTDAKSKPE